MAVNYLYLTCFYLAVGNSRHDGAFLFWQPRWRKELSNTVFEYGNRTRYSRATAAYNYTNKQHGNDQHGSLFEPNFYGVHSKGKTLKNATPPVICIINYNHPLWEFTTSV